MLDPALTWFLIGIGLLMAEMAVPGLVLGFFAIGAWFVALLTWIGVTPSLNAQIFTFTLSSIGSLLLLRRYVKGWFVGDEGRDELADEFIAKEVSVLEAIPGGHATGKVELKGADWKARSTSPIPAGSLARVIERDGLCLVVEPLD